MARIVKVIELLAQSDKSWEDAAQSAVTEASKTLRNIRTKRGCNSGPAAQGHCLGHDGSAGRCRSP